MQDLTRRLEDFNIRLPHKGIKNRQGRREGQELFEDDLFLQDEELYLKVNIECNA